MSVLKFGGELHGLRQIRGAVRGEGGVQEHGESDAGSWKSLKKAGRYLRAWMRRKHMLIYDARGDAR